MQKLLLMIGAATLAVAAPVAAKPDKAAGHGKAHAAMQHGKAKAHSTKASGKSGKAVVRHARLDRDRDGIDDRDEALARKYGGALCPPGLAKKSPPCVPPGQANRIFREGQRVPTNYRYYTPYADIPIVLRERYDLDDDYRYIYRNNVIYRVDPATNLITSIINAIL